VSPLQVADTPKKPPLRAPPLGEYTRSALATLGFSAADTDGLLQNGAVRQEGVD